MVRGIKNGIPIVIESTNVDLSWWTDSYFGGIWESETFKVFATLLTPEMTMLDLGTFEGHTVLYAAHKVKMVYGLECDPHAFYNCIKNIEANNLQNVIVLPFAISDKSGITKITGQHYNPLIFGHSGSRLDNNGSISVSSVTVEDLLERQDIEKVDFVKMDIEGGEEFVIPAMIDFLKEHKPILYISFHPHLMANREFDHDINYQEVDRVKPLTNLLNMKQG